jgi:hypothetical protein
MYPNWTGREGMKTHTYSIVTLSFNRLFYLFIYVPNKSSKT